ncbi:hypothetical protein MMC11_003614 [Xylographa trunciseda]|nr:hypothetical protein [Xylographa trunciseda]
MSTSLADLSQELIFQITSNLEPGRGTRIARGNTRTGLPLYATISKKFQYAVEYRTFNSIELDSDQLAYFAQICFGHRRTFLATLIYRPILLNYPREVFADYEDINDEHSNNQALTDAVAALFEVLKSWEDADEIVARERSSRPMELHLLEPRSLMDTGIPSLQLLYPEDLPPLSRILQFSGHASHFRRIEPRSLVMITASLIGLKTIDWELSDEEKTHALTAQNNRFAFARSLSYLSTESLAGFRLHFERKVPINHEFEPPSVLLPSDPATDHFSLALHALSLSHNLTEIILSGPLVISASLFWPASSPSTPFWPNVQKVVVEFTPIAPDGSWYFSREELDAAAHTAALHSEHATMVVSISQLLLGAAQDDCYNAATAQARIGAFPVRESRTAPDAPPLARPHARPRPRRRPHAALEAPPLRRLPPASRSGSASATSPPERTTAPAGTWAACLARSG